MDVQHTNLTQHPRRPSTVSHHTDQASQRPPHVQDLKLTRSRRSLDEDFRYVFPSAPSEIFPPNET
nr:hypothetical protein GCM10010200_015520 [Actinomadura rugatobispora]